MKILRQAQRSITTQELADDGKLKNIEEVIPSNVQYQLGLDGTKIQFVFHLSDSVLNKQSQGEVLLIDTKAQETSTITTTNGDIPVSINMEEYRGQIIDIEYSESGLAPSIMVTPAMTNFALGGNLPNRLLRNSELRLARIVINEEANDAVVQLMKPSGEIAGFENVVMGSEKTFLGHLLDNSPLAGVIIAKSARKSRLLSNIDPRDSLTYLEIQLDALTRYVLGGNSDPKALELLQKSEQYSSLDAREQEQLLAEFYNKANVREQLSKYYEATAEYAESQNLKS